MMNVPQVCVEVLRGGIVESYHLIDVAIVDADDAIVGTFGTHDRQIFPRSSIKALQALPLVESGAADAFGFDAKHLALACASHNGETMHSETAQQMLDLAGVSATCLECGTQLPSLPQTLAELHSSGQQAWAIHNNCSGKHAGFLAFAAHSELPSKNYIHIDHPVQREIAQVLESVTGVHHNAQNSAIDGCSIPTYGIPLNRLAYAFARFGVGLDASQSRSNAMKRLRDACISHPEMVAGTDRVCTKLMIALNGRIFVKVGAEGVYTAAIPELGVGIALKALDGNARAAEVAIAWLAQHMIDLSVDEKEALAPLVQPVLKNWNKMEIGEIRVSSEHDEFWR